MKVLLALLFLSCIVTGACNESPSEPSAEPENKESSSDEKPDDKAGAETEGAGDSDHGAEIDSEFAVDSNSDSGLDENTYAIGDFRIELNIDDDDTRQIVITHVAEPTRPIWETNPGQAFVTSRLTRTTVEQWRGSFKITENQLGMCEKQTINDVRKDNERLNIEGGFRDCDVHYALTFFLAEERQLGFNLTVTPVEPPKGESTLWRAVLSYGSDLDEHFFGFGEQFTYLDIKGRKLPILSQEQGHGRGLEPLTSWLNRLGNGAAGAWHTTYAPAPQYITNTNRSLFIENYEYMTFDLEEEDAVHVEIDASSLQGRILYGASPLDLIEEYTRFAGRMPPLPRWIGNGAVVGLQGGSELVREYLQLLKEHDVSIAALWMQDWVGQRVTALGTRMWWNWEVDLDTYPDWEDLVAELNDQGIRVMGYVNPWLSDVSSKPNHRSNYFKEAEAAGYLLKDKQGQPKMVDSGGFSGALIDFSNPDARAWLISVMRDEFIGNGLSGWMADFGEAVPFDTVPFSGESPRTFHNKYTEEWSKMNREVIEEAGLLGEVVAFLRAGFTRAPRYNTLFWLGDQLSSWDRFDGIKTAVTGLLSSGFSGFSLNHSDIGGCIAFDYVIIKYQRTQELLVRWMEMNAFTTAFRNHEGNNPVKGGHQIYSAPKTLDYFARFSKIFAALNDYRQELMIEARDKGYPLVRHPILHYPTDPAVVGIEYQFMLGSEFMIAPVLDQGVKKVSLYLPAGEWIHLWSGKTYGSVEQGTNVTIDAPWGYPAVFFRKNSPQGEAFRSKLAEQGLLE